MTLDNEKYRIDSEFYLKRYISAYQRIKTIKHTTINDSMSCLTDFHANGSYETIAANFELLDSPNYAYMVRTTDLETENYSENVKYVTKQAYEFLAKSKIFGGELLINKIGSPGRTYLMPKLNMPVSLGMNLFMLRIKGSVNTNESLLYLFFNSFIGKAIIERKINGTVPLTIDKEAIKSLYVPLFSEKFNNILLTLITRINTLKSKSKNCYESAERLLNEYLGFTSIDLADSCTIKTLSNSFMQSERLDAEYYQQKYDEYEQAIKKYVNGFTTIKEKFDLVIDKCSRDLSQYRYIEIGDINVGNGSYTYNVLNITELPDNAKTMTRAGDILVSTVRPNRGAVAILEENDLLVSGAFTVLRPKSDYSREILQVLLRTPIYRDWLLKFNVGTSYPVIKDSDVLNLPIPLLEENIQKGISDKVQESFRLRKEAKRLLDNAIKAVELAIETDEETAFKWLEKQTN